MTQDTSVLREDDHDRDLVFVHTRVTAVRRATPSLQRVTVELAPADRDADWGAPNVAIRLELGPDYEDASRVYTVRAYDAARGLLDIDLVLHGQPSPMMRWAAAVRVGDELRFRGPRPHFRVPEPAADPQRPAALFLDETAIPALATLLEHWPAGRPAVGWVVTDDEEAFAELPAIAGVELHRVGSAGDSLVARARTLADPAGYAVWGAGERDEMREVRRFFRSELNLAKDDVAVFGYWKRGVSNTEIDNARLAAYEALRERGGGLEEIDDLAVEV